MFISLASFLTGYNPLETFPPTDITPRGNPRASVRVRTPRRGWDRVKSTNLVPVFKFSF